MTEKKDEEQTQLASLDPVLKAVVAHPDVHTACELGGGLFSTATLLSGCDGLVTTVESNKEWYDKLLTLNCPNLSHWRPMLVDQVESPTILRYIIEGESSDVLLVDSAPGSLRGFLLIVAVRTKIPVIVIHDTNVVPLEWYSLDLVDANPNDWDCFHFTPEGGGNATTVLVNRHQRLSHLSIETPEGYTRYDSCGGKVDQ